MLPSALQGSQAAHFWTFAGKLVEGSWALLTSVTYLGISPHSCVLDLALCSFFTLASGVIDSSPIVASLKVAGTSSEQLGKDQIIFVAVSQGVEIRAPLLNLKSPSLEPCMTSNGIG